MFNPLHGLKQMLNTFSHLLGTVRRQSIETLRAK